jgi:hypothetical protein
MRGVPVLLTFLFIGLSVPLSAQTTGSVSGCVRDTLNYPLPRANVSITAPGLRLAVVADAEGCYQFPELPPHVYRVTARLPGLDNTTRDKVSVGAGQAQRVDLVTAPSSICECLADATTLRELFERADAVVYLKIVDANSDEPSPRGFFRQHVASLDVLKRHQGLAPAMTFLQDQSSGAPDPYQPGEELVLFLMWSPGAGTYVSFTTRTHMPNPGYNVVVIQDGRVARAQGSLAHYRGAPLENLLADLRKIADGQ